MNYLILRFVTDFAYVSQKHIHILENNDLPYK